MNDVPGIDFAAWLRVELAEALIGERSSDYPTRKAANTRVEMIKSALQLVTEYETGRKTGT